MKRAIVFIIPGLTDALPRAWENDVKNFKLEPTLEHVLKRAHYENKQYGTYTKTVQEYFKLPSCSSWSRFGLIGEGIKVHSTDWLKMEILTEYGFPLMDARDIQKIAEDFARDFAFGEDAIVTNSGRWYISPQGANNFESTPIWQQDDVKDKVTSGLTGNDAATWQLRFRAANDWLKKHPVNELRARRKRAAITHLWPWGNGGEVDSSGAPDFSAVFSNNPLYLGLGAHLGISFFPLRFSTGDLNQMMHNHPHICVVDDALIESMSEGSFSTWTRARANICAKLIEPAVLAIERGILEEFTIDNGLGERFIYNKRIKLVITRPKFTYTFQ